MKFGILTVSDRASRGEYEDKGGPAIKSYLEAAVSTPWTAIVRVIPDGVESVRRELLDLCDKEGVSLILATGGTGPTARDTTPEAMGLIVEKELPGCGELMRRVSLQQVPTAILSRQGAGIRGKTLIVTLPGKPAAIKVCLDAVFPAIPYCLDLIESWLPGHPQRRRGQLQTKAIAQSVIWIFVVRIIIARHEPGARELCGNLGDKIDQAALCGFISMTSIPSWNLTPASSLGN